jgi:hypothetical protein
VFERDPGTFAGALALAQTKTVTDVTFKSALRGASIHAFANPSENSVNFASKGCGGGRGSRGKSSVRPKRREGEAGKCWVCNSSSHQRAECPVWIKAMAFAFPPPTDKREVEAGAPAVAEQTTKASPPAAVDPLCPLSPPPPLPHAEKLTHRCLKAKTSGRSRKTRQAGFGPAGRGAGYNHGDTSPLSA